MKCIVTADWHLHPWRECSLDGGQDRLNDGFSAVRQILDAGRKHECPVVIIGDIKHVKTTWLVTVQNALAQIFYEYQDVHKILIHGNHDGWAHGRSGLAVLQTENTEVFDEPIVGIFKDWAFWPYRKDLSQLPEFLDEARKKKAKVLFAHAFLQQGRLGPTEIRLSTGFSLDDFGLGKNSIFDIGFFGDIHKQQAIDVRRAARVWYPGSPYAQNWGEQEDNKGYLLVDLDNGDVVPYQVQAPRFRVTEISNWSGKAPRGGFTIGIWEGDFVRFIVRSDVDPKVLEQLREQSKARVFQVVMKRQSKTEQRSEVHAAMSREQLLGEYLQFRPPGEGMTTSAMLKAGLKLMEDP